MRHREVLQSEMRSYTFEFSSSRQRAGLPGSGLELERIDPALLDGMPEFNFWMGKAVCQSDAPPSPFGLTQRWLSPFPISETISLDGKPLKQHIPLRMIRSSKINGLDAY